MAKEKLILQSLEEIKERLDFIEVSMKKLFEVRPEYIEKLKRIEKEGKFHRYANVNELRKAIEK